MADDFDGSSGSGRGGGFYDSFGDGPRLEMDTIAFSFVFVSKCKIVGTLFPLGIMGLPMVEEDGVVVVVAAVVVEDTEIEDLNLFPKNLRLQRLSADFHQIRFKEILIRSSRTLRYNSIAIKADKTTRHFAMFVISSVDSSKHVDDLWTMTSLWCRKSVNRRKLSCAVAVQNFDQPLIYFFRPKTYW